jgi:hypothetical protein
VSDVFSTSQTAVALGISGALLICFLLLRSKTDLRSKPKNSAVFADAPSEAQENIQEGNEVSVYMRWAVRTQSEHH